MNEVKVTALTPHYSTHSVLIGYLAWIFGVFGAHRFYFGKRVTGIIWLFTFGLFFVGWVIDLFLIPRMAEDASREYKHGNIDYTVAWLLLSALGVFGAHRFYMGKIGTGILWLCTGGLFLVGLLYDVLTLNEQVSDLNADFQAQVR